MKYEHPNILFVFSDQHRCCSLGCYGNSEVVSPNLDDFAVKAAKFENCISNSPVCVPARGSILTGLFPIKHRAITNDLPIDVNTTSIANVLNEVGYHTGYIGKWHLAGVPREKFIPEGKGRLGFKEWKVYNCSHSYLNACYFDENDKRVEIDGYEPIEQTNLALDFIMRNKEKQWALFLSWGPPHDPYTEVPEKYLEIYRDKEITLRDNVTDEAVVTLLDKINREQIIKSHRGYYAHITALDEQFGRLVNILEQIGQMENTVIVYTSDHGDMLGSQGYVNKQHPYEESIKVPLLVYWKGITANVVSRGMLGLVDLPVSILGLVGLKFPLEVDGKDMHELFTQMNAKGLDECYIFDLIPCHQSAARGGWEWRGIRTRRYTFARTISDEGYMLYDNENDPMQMRNLINMREYSDVRKELLETLNSYICRYDGLLPWEGLIREFGVMEEWNNSQTYFNLPILK